VRARCVLEHAFGEDLVRDIEPIIIGNNARMASPAEDQNEMKDALESNKEPVLLSNYPNPFNGTTTITYYLPETANNGEIVVYDMVTGRVIRTIILNGKGYGKVIFDAVDLGNGLYFYKMSVDDNIIATKKMMLIK